MSRRVPPHSEEAERGVLGSLMMDQRRVFELCNKFGVTSESFYTPSNQILFEKLEEMNRAGLATDLLTIGEKLKSEGKIDAVGGYGFLEGIIDDTPTSAHAQYYIEIMMQKQMLRKICARASEALDSAMSEAEDPESIVSGLTTSLVEIKTQRECGVTTDMIVRSYEEAMNGHKKCIPTPFDGLTMRTGGPMLGMETILTGRAKSGKSMLKSFWHRYLGELGIPSLDCPYEDGVHVAKSRCASIGRYSAGAVIRGGRYVSQNGTWVWEKITPRDIHVAKNQLERLDAMPMYWDEERVTPDRLQAKLARYVNDFGIKAAFLDGAKDVKRPTGKYNDTGFDEEISAAITESARSLNIAIISIYHLTKLAQEELIQSTHIRGSGNIVSSSRLVYALQGDRTGLSLNTYSGAPALDYDSEGYCTTRVLECIDNNHGELGKVWLGTDLGLCSFWPMMGR